MRHYRCVTAQGSDSPPSTRGVEEVLQPLSDELIQQCLSVGPWEHNGRPFWHRLLDWAVDAGDTPKRLEQICCCLHSRRSRVILIFSWLCTFFKVDKVLVPLCEILVNTFHACRLSWYGEHNLSTNRLHGAVGYTDQGPPFPLHSCGRF